MHQDYSRETEREKKSLKIIVSRAMKKGNKTSVSNQIAYLFHPFCSLKGVSPLPSRIV